MGSTKSYLIDFCILLSIIALFFPMATSLTVVNSDNWKDTFHGLEVSHFEGDEVFVVETPGDLELLYGLKKDKIKLKTSSDPVIPQLDRRLESEGFEVQNKKLSWRNQYTNYERVKKNVSGFLVVPPEFSSEALTAFPKVIQDNYYLVFYDQNTVSFLESEGKPAVFVGEFTGKPWRGIDIERQAVDQNDKNKRNRVFVSKFLSGDTAMLTDLDDIDVEALRSGKPILFRSDIDQLSAFIESENYSAIEILGPENLFYGQQLKNTLDKDTRFAAKMARTFTGIDVSGQQYPLKQIDLKIRKSDVSLNQVIYDRENEQLGIVFRNNGNAKANVRIKSIETKNISKTVSIEPEQKLTYTLDYISPPKNIEVVAFAEDERLVGDNGLQPEEVVKTPIESNKSVDLESIFYNRTSNYIEINLNSATSRKAKIGLNKGEKSYFTGTFGIEGKETVTVPHYFEEAPTKVEVQLYEGENTSDITLVASQTSEVEIVPKTLSERADPILLTVSVLLIISIKFILLRDERKSVSKLLQRLNKFFRN